MGDQIRDLTLYVLNESAQQWKAWRHDGFCTIVSINLSARVLMDKSFVADVRRILQAHGMPGENVHFEITESAMLTDPARAIETITDLNTLGIGFSVDDFGIGFSSLSSLKQLPLASLKIDRSFISQMATSEHDTSIVRSTIRPRPRPRTPGGRRRRGGGRFARYGHAHGLRPGARLRDRPARRGPGDPRLGALERLELVCCPG